MKCFLKPRGGLNSLLSLAAGIATLFQFSAPGLETPPEPKFRVDNSVINRDGRGETSFAPVVKKTAPSVVNIYSTRTVRPRRMDVPFLDDPMFRQFFGGNQSQRPHQEKGLGSGVIV